MIAAHQGVAAKTVREWRRDYRAGGRAALVSAKPPGRPAKLTSAQREALAGLLERTPAGCGFAGRNVWTQQLIAHLILRELGVPYRHDRGGGDPRADGLRAPEAGPAGAGAGRGEGGGVAAGGPARASKKMPTPAGWS